MIIRINWDRGSLTATLENNPCAQAFYDALPVSASASTWGDEVYFGLLLNAAKSPEATEVVEPGTICYWPDGCALALPFGPTPISEGEECRLAGAVNVLGRIEGDPETLRSVRNGSRITVERAA